MTTSLSYLAAPSPESDAGERAARIVPGLLEHYWRALEPRFPDGYCTKEAVHIMAISVSNAKVVQPRALRVVARLAQEAGR